MKTYINYIVSLPEEQFEIAGAALSDTPLLGITEGNDILTICYEMPEQPEEFASIMLALLREYGCTPELIGSEAVEEQNWNAEWEASIEPIRVSEKVVITPEWKKGELSAELEIIINPKMSFGTGHHQTTQMMSRAVENLVRPNTFWIDAGSGTGVLAILAAKLGAKVFAFDFDDWAVENAHENIALNNISTEQLRMEKADVLTVPLPNANGILANIHRNVLERCFDRFYAALKNNKGTLVVSGLLRYDEDDIIRLAQQNGFRHTSTDHDGEWIAITFALA